jgi:hypothetical protein
MDLGGNYKKNVKILVSSNLFNDLTDVTHLI